MANAEVSSFLNEVRDNAELREGAKNAFQSGGASGLVSFAAEHGKNFSQQDLDAVISPEHINSGLQGTSIGWS